MLRSLSKLFFWLIRAWPVLSLGPIWLAHRAAYSLFSYNTVLVDKIAGSTLQVIGSFLILYSINSNLGLFKNQHLGKVIRGWIQSFPLFRRPVTGTLNASVKASTTTFGTPRISTIRATSTIEERVADLERQLEEVRQQTNEDIRVLNDRIADLYSKLSTDVAQNTTIAKQISSKLEEAITGDFKQQAFGVIITLYGTLMNVFF
ncbi:MAG: hypothetical protein ACOYNR_08265 [Blastocatellia bacterium]|jgi:hypothetical protein